MSDPRRLNALSPGQAISEGNDALYVPQMSYFTGDLDVHDVDVMGDGRQAFVNTLFNCIATTSRVNSFVHLWAPPFISRLAAEDRCHLNGLALRDGKPAFAMSDTFDGWRDQRQDGGIVIVIDIETGRIVCEGLQAAFAALARGPCVSACNFDPVSG